MAGTTLLAGRAGAAARHGLTALLAALSVGQLGFHIYAAPLPVYLDALHYDATLIGLLVAATGPSQFLGSLFVGPAIDALGPRRLILFGVACYVLAAVGFVFATAVPALAALRVIQGLGMAAVLPAGMSFVPGLAPPQRRVMGFAAAGAAGNLAMAVGPPVGMALYGYGGVGALSAGAVTAALLGLGLVVPLPAPKTTRRRITFVFRTAWLPPLAVDVLIVIQFAMIAAFVPLQAIAAGTGPATFFSADAVALLLMRLPAGWVAGRLGLLRMEIVGVLCMLGSIALLLLPLTDPLVAVSGALNGAGGAITIIPLLAQLSERSDDATRGSAMAYFSASYAVGVVIGSGVGGLLFPLLGFPGLLIATWVLCASSILVATFDPWRGRAAVAIT